MNTLSDGKDQLTLPPLSLYVHLPWCVKKCPYCDFNSHALHDEIPAAEYVKALICDLENDLPMVWGRPVHSIFFGGGTPSLFSAAYIGEFLDAVRSRLQLAPAAEVTLEANPGTVEYDSFSAYRNAGINRVSLGVQSFDDEALARLGRIHGRQEIILAIQSIKDSGIDNFNLDLMFGLPGQSIEAAVDDVDQAVAQGPTHISHYQLTLEPNTAFHADPPQLPNEESCWDMQQACADRLGAAGFEQYEISAWGQPDKQCAHNLNYWKYGDYLGVGAGAHSKLTLPAEGVIRRAGKQRHPNAYLKALKDGSWRVFEQDSSNEERCFEFFLNQLRLKSGVNMNDFSPRTGLPWESASEAVSAAKDKGLLEQRENLLVPTELGWRFVNDIQAMFLPPQSNN